MRVLYVVHQFFPTHYTGTERFTFDLCKQMQKMGYPVDVLTYGIADDTGYGYTKNDFLIKEYEFDGVPVTSIRHKHMPEDVSFDIFMAEMEEFLYEHLPNYDLIHVFHPMRLGTVIRVAKKLNIPTILTLTDFWIICPMAQLLTPSGKLCYGASEPQKCVKDCYGKSQADKLTRRFKEMKELVRMVDHIIAPTYSLASMIKRVLDVYISVIPYGIDYTFVKNIPEKSRENLTLGFIGSVLPHKGVHTLIAAIKLLDYNNVRVKIYGDYFHAVEYIHQLKNLADKDGRIEFTGKYDYSEISRILSELDVVVVPSIWWENAPFTIQTSFAYKTPVIASNLGGMSEVVKDGVNGFLFEAGNAESLAEIIRRITKNPEILNRIGDNIVSPSRIEEVAFEYEKIYWSLLSGSSLEAPLPPKELSIFVGDGDFKAIGEDFVQYFIELCDLKPNERVLDVGCGIGRMAIPLTKYLNKNGSYEGFDIVKRGIDWCRKNISSKYPNFHFQLANIFNKFYNPEGKYNALEYKFPYENESFDFISLTSVFTHMLPQDMENYFSEIARVLKKDGRCLITFFLLNEESLKLIDAKRSLVDFKYIFERYATTDKNVPEAVLSYDEQFIRMLYDKYGLNIVEPIRYGSWCGRKKFLSFQDNIIASKIAGKSQQLLASTNGDAKYMYKAKYGNDFIFNIDKRDEMYQFLVTHPDIKDPIAEYFHSGELMLTNLQEIFKEVGYSFDQIGSFLDFAGGYGRFTRFLIQKLSHEKITVSDIDKNAVDFVKRTFGVNGFYSVENPDRLIHDNKYDVIYVASLFSHLSLKLWGGWLKRLYDMLNEGGMLIFSTHGRYCYDLLDDETRTHVKKVEEGFFYLPLSETKRLSTNDYGTTYVTYNYVEKIIRQNNIGKIIAHYPKKLWDFQDIYVIPKDNLNTDTTEVVG